MSDTPKKKRLVKTVDINGKRYISAADLIAYLKGCAGPALSKDALVSVFTDVLINEGEDAEL